MPNLSIIVESFMGMTEKKLAALRMKSLHGLLHANGLIRSLIRLKSITFANGIFL